jgi:ketosteroid isomerase-like protein
MWSDHRYEFDGASLVKLAEGKIAELREYRMTERPYNA